MDMSNRTVAQAIDEKTRIALLKLALELKGAK